MMQEIITYMIIGAAIYAVISRIVRSFTGKKTMKKRINLKSETFSMAHNCNDCSADCMLRNKINPLVKEEVDFCKKVEIR